MAKRVARPSSFLRFSLIPSHNVSGQLLKLEDRCTLYKSLCTLLLLYVFPAKPYLGGKNILCMLK